MARATVLDEVAPSPGRQSSAVASEEPRGDPVVVPGALGSLDVDDATSADVQAQGATAVPRPHTDLPDRLQGKVFFSIGSGNFVCSGTLINNPKKNTVWTAGHCVHEGRGGSFVSNWAFVPGYSSTNNGDRPFGTWTAQDLFVMNGWANSGDFSFDLGAAALSELNGQKLGDLIGGQGIAFNLSDQQNFSSFGYPRGSPFDGEVLYRCNSAMLGRDPNAGAGDDSMRIACDMTGGSSGGGWLINIGGNGVGTVNSVNSYKYVSGPLADRNSMYGPYHGQAAANLYNGVKDVGPK